MKKHLTLILMLSCLSAYSNYSGVRNEKIAECELLIVDPSQELTSIEMLNIVDGVIVIKNEFKTTLPIWKFKEKMNDAAKEFNGALTLTRKYDAINKASSLIPQGPTEFLKNQLRDMIQSMFYEVDTCQRDYLDD